MGIQVQLIRPRRQNGSKKPPNKAMQKLNINWAICINLASVFRKTEPKGLSGTKKLPNKAMHWFGFAWA
jgi:hypothetical protein